MAWLYEKSPAWRRFVHTLKGNPKLMASFTAGTGIVSLFVGNTVMELTNPGLDQDEARKRMVSQNSSLDTKVMGAANKDRLQMLLDEVKAQAEGRSDGTASEERYKLALQGKTMGTSSGSSVRDVK
mmetsp:Transcript_18759/g.63883  ORF Transcript_18759/g.63883 Transcript_18759/m.63883 type:complete len:126 (-) Transcript_18759:53-430(-)